jgi:hypothetical protein
LWIKLKVGQTAKTRRPGDANPRKTARLAIRILITMTDSPGAWWLEDDARCEVGDGRIEIVRLRECVEEWERTTEVNGQRRRFTVYGRPIEFSAILSINCLSVSKAGAQPQVTLTQRQRQPQLFRPRYSLPSVICGSRNIVLMVVQAHLVHPGGCSFRSRPPIAIADDTKTDRPPAPHWVLTTAPRADALGAEHGDGVGDVLRWAPFAGVDGDAQPRLAGFFEYTLKIRPGIFRFIARQIDPDDAMVHALDRKARHLGSDSWPFLAIDADDEAGLHAIIRGAVACLEHPVDDVGERAFCPAEAPVEAGSR